MLKGHWNSVNYINYNDAFTSSARILWIWDFILATRSAVLRSGTLDIEFNITCAEVP